MSVESQVRPVETHRGRDAYARVALFGIGLFLVALSVLFVAILVDHLSEAWFILFFLVPALVVAAALWFWRRWGLIVGIVGSVIGLLVLVEDIGLIVSTPSAFFDFTAVLVGIVGLIIALIASLVGTVQYFRKQPAYELGPGTVTALKAVSAALLVLAAVSGVFTLLETRSVSASERQGAEVVTANATKWDREFIDVPAGSNLKIVVKNKDLLLHTFTIHDLDVDVKLGALAEKVVVLENLAPGNYGFVCRFLDHDVDMTGVIRVR